MSDAKEIDEILNPEMGEIHKPRSTPPPIPTNDLALAIDASARPPILYLAMLITSLLVGVFWRLVVIDAQRNGLNAFVFVGVLVAGWLICARIRNVPRWRKLCAFAGLLSALMFGWRDSEILNRVSALLMIGFLSLSFLPSQLNRMKSIPGLFTDGVQLLFNYFFGGLMNLVETPWRQICGDHKTNGNVLRMLIGFFIALPFLLVFGLLFAKAETSFGAMFSSLFNLLSFDISDDLFAIAFLAYIAFGAMRSSFIAVSLGEQFGMPVNTSKLKLGLVESGTVLFLLNVMFLAFVATQLPYFFGGQARVTNTAGLAWSDYARKGFFELATVIALVVPTLLLFLSITKTESRREHILLHGLCGFLILLCVVIIMSALQRMLLYTANYGLTELRIYVTAFIVMLAIILAMLMVLSLWQQRMYFVPFVLATGLFFTVVLHMVNVQGWVAKDIINRKAMSLPHDIELLKSLSADAVPAIVRSDLDSEHKQKIASEILSRSIVKGNAPGLLERSWSYQRALAVME